MSRTGVTNKPYYKLTNKLSSTSEYDDGIWSASHIKIVDPTAEWMWTKRYMLKAKKLSPNCSWFMEEIDVSSVVDANDEKKMYATPWRST